MSEGKVTIRRHVRRRTGHTAKIAARLGFDPAIEVESYTRRRAAVPKWSQTSYSPGKETYRGNYKGVSLYVGRAADGSWYWSARTRGFFKDSVQFIQDGGPQSLSPGEAARRAELAAGYEYAKTLLDFPAQSPVPLGTRVRKEIGEF